MVNLRPTAFKNFESSHFVQKRNRKNIRPRGTSAEKFIAHTRKCFLFNFFVAKILVVEL